PPVGRGAYRRADRRAPGGLSPPGARRPDPPGPARTGPPGRPGRRSDPAAVASWPQRRRDRRALGHHAQGRKGQAAPARPASPTPPPDRSIGGPPPVGGRAHGLGDRRRGRLHAAHSRTAPVGAGPPYAGGAAQPEAVTFRDNFTGARFNGARYSEGVRGEHG